MIFQNGDYVAGVGYNFEQKKMFVHFLTKSNYYIKYIIFYAKFQRKISCTETVNLAVYIVNTSL